MKRCIVTVGAFLFGHSNFASAQGACAAIQLPKDATATTISGTARSSDPLDCFTLTAGPAQAVTLRLVHEPGDDVALSIVGLTADRDQYTLQTQPKTYVVSIYRVMARAPDEPFTMVISVSPAQPFRRSH